ncbi:MAG: winged helix-turn-helix transcriptional regulator [Caulobacterales bacterium]|nr:winged helix-turn-helix transcriptional regulator [Caulobacterales bacterium]
MDSTIAIECFFTLGHGRRLDVLRLLIRHAPEGLKAGDIAAALGRPASTMSTHLRLLAQTGLIRSERRGREIWFRPNLERVRELVVFLVADCCGAPADRSAKLFASLVSCCA